MMDTHWKQLTREEKRKQRRKWFLNPGVTFVSPEAETAYKMRVQRLIDAYRVEKPDRVPVLMSIGGMPAYLYGTDYRTVMYDHRKATEAWTKFKV